VRTVPYINIGRQHDAIRQELLAAADRVLSQGNFILGDEVARFEEAFAVYCGAPHAVGVNSGTDALILALKAAGVGAGDEVITVSHSFVATATAIALTGARPVFIDVDWDQNMNPALLEAAVTPRTRAVIPVHLTGRPAKMDAICAVAAKHKLAVIEDAAQAVAAEYKGRRIGAWGDFGCFSFHPLKNLSACGDGGIITVKSAAHADALRRLRNIGLKDRDTCVDVSGNSRLDTLQAAFLSVKLKHLDAVTQARRRHAQIYNERLKGLVDVPSPTADGLDVYHVYVVQTDRREALKAFLAENGVDCKIHYPRAIHQQEAFRPYAEGARLPVTEALVQRILSLPIEQSLSDEDIHYVADQIERFCRLERKPAGVTA